MLRLTWRNLLGPQGPPGHEHLRHRARHRFLAGVLIFSHGLGATFDNIIEGSTSDAVVAHRGRGVASRPPVPATTSSCSPRSSSGSRAARGGRGRRLGRRRRRLPPRQGRQARRRHRRPRRWRSTTSTAPTPPVTRSCPGVRHLARRSPVEIILDASSAERGGYELGDEVTLLLPTGEPRQTFDPRRHVRLQRRRHRRRHARAASTPARRRTSSSTARTPSRP